MAISFIEAGAEGSAASGNITLGAPASPVNGDIWIAIVHSSDQVAHSFTDWTQIAQGNGGGTTSRLSVWWFRYAGTTPNLVVTHTAGQSPIGGILAFRGCATNNPINVIGAITAGTDASIEIAAVTTTLADCMLVACDGAADDNNRTPVPSGFSVGFEDTAGGTQNSYQTAAGTPDGSVAGFYKAQATAGDSGAFTDTQAAADPWASVLLALRPEPSVGFDVASGTQAVGISSLTWSHTCSGTDRLLLVGVGQTRAHFGSGNDNAPSGVTYNSVAMTKVFEKKEVLSADVSFWVSMWSLVAPDTGAHNIVVTFTTGQSEAYGIGLSYTSVSQSDPLGTAVTANGTTDPTSVTVTSAPGQIVVDAIMTGQPSVTIEAGQLSRREEENINFSAAGGMSEEAGASSVTMGWSMGAGGYGGDHWCQGAVPVKPPGGSLAFAYNPMAHMLVR